MVRLATFGFNQFDRLLVARLVDVDANQYGASPSISLSGFPANAMTSSGDLCVMGKNI